MVIVSPLSSPLQMSFSWLINGGDPNQLLTGMILQVPQANLAVQGFLIHTYHTSLVPSLEAWEVATVQHHHAATFAGYRGRKTPLKQGRFM